MQVDPNKDPQKTDPNTNPKGNQNQSGINVSTEQFNNLMSGFKSMKNTVHNLGVKLENRQNHNPNVSHVEQQKQHSASGNVGKALNNNHSDGNSNDNKIKELTNQVSQLQNQRKQAITRHKLSAYATNSLKKNKLPVDSNTLQHVMGNDTQSIDGNIKFLKSYTKGINSNHRKVPKSTQRKQNNVNVGAELFKQTQGSKRSLDQYIQGNKGGQY